MGLQAVSVLCAMGVAFALFEVLRHGLAFEHILLSDIQLDANNNTVSSCLQGGDCLHMRNDVAVYELLAADVGRANLPVFAPHGVFIGLTSGAPDADASSAQRRHSG